MAARVVTLLLLLSVRIALPLSFEEWCKEEGKSYATEEERKEREAVFTSNAILVDQLNKQYESRWAW